MKNLKLILEASVIIIALIGGTWGAIHVFATNEDVTKIENELAEEIQLVGQRLDKKILKDRLNAVEERIWKYQDKYGPNCELCDEEAKETFRRLLQERRELEAKLKEGG